MAGWTEAGPVGLHEEGASGTIRKPSAVLEQYGAYLRARKKDQR